MHRQQSADVAARVVLGGKVGPAIGAKEVDDPKAWYAGRMPGVLEEAYETLVAGKPLYLCGAFGGAAALAVELVEGREAPAFSWEYQKRAPHSEGMRALYQDREVPWIDYPDMRRRFADLGVAGLSRANGLSVDENRELFVARDPTRIVALLLEGMTKALRAPG